MPPVVCPSQRRLKVLALGVWLAMAASVGSAAWLWRSYELRPHGALVAANLAAILGTTAWLTLHALRVATCGRAPRAAIGWWLIGTAPILWFVAYAANLYIDVNYRQPLTLDAPLRMTGAWAASFFELEARVRCPHRTSGKHSILLDSGDVALPETLVAQMDEHVASMTRLLGQPPLAAPVIWVRGSILGMTGRSIGFWAIAGPNGNSDALDPVDRHEAAHATITMLAGPDHDPPAVISEGWAESQSADRDNQIRQLARERESGAYYSVRELIAPDWYMRSMLPVYSHGGPLVHYLIGRFGAPKFFEFYCGVRRATFLDDCQRLLGVSWDEIDADFWRWVAAENERLVANVPPTAEPAPKRKLELADGVNPADSQQLVEELMARSDRPLPKRIAFAARWDWKRCDGDRRTEPIDSKNELLAALAGEDVWIYDRGDNESFLMSSSGRAASLTLTRSGDVEGWVGDAASRRRARNDATQFVRAYRNACNFWPELWLPIGETDGSSAAYRLERIERPVDGKAGVWKVVVSIEYDDESSKYCELEIDPAIDWQITRSCTVGSPESYTEESAEYRQIDGVWFATAAKFEANYVHTKERVSAETSFRTLTDTEVRDLKQRVERMALAGPTKPWHRLRNLLLALVVVWPAVGLLYIALPPGRQRNYFAPTANSDATDTATTAPSSGPTTGIQA